ncbi:hypothetical protein [Halalkalibaculum sp. DA3122]|uniref:hypothetical protein n=2 Tax=unclassified Halalkalibaculum TaxID=2964617 RepID=UPI0037548DD1
MDTELQQMFYWFWDGTPEDRLYAWYKVRTVLKQRQDREAKNKVAEVERKIMSFDKTSMHGNLSVDEKGQLIIHSGDYLVR